MTTGIAEPLSTVPPATAEKNFLQRIIGVLFSPEETFQDIVRRPNVVVPLLVFLVLGYITTFVIMPIMDWDAVIAQQTEAMHKQNPNMTDADVQRMTGITKTMGRVMGYIGPIFGLVWWLVVTGVLFLAFRLFGGQGTFGSAFGVTLYAWVPLTIFSILLTIIARAKGAFDPTHAATIVMSNPAFLVDMKEHPVLFAFLSSFDIFTIWTIILLIIGYAVMARVSKAKSASIVLPLWVLMILIKVGFAAMGAARMKG